MESMYSNRVTLAVNEKEAYFKFDLVTPKYDENNNPIGEETINSQSIIMTKDALLKVRGLIDECLNAESKKA